jgi:predicted Zn-dependent peptidase
MKLISHFKNKHNNITYKTYVTENGIKVLHLDNPATVDFNFSILIQAGSAYEDMEKVPHGTAHFLEHMLLNPNITFKSKESIDIFEKGDRNTPALNINGSTTRKNIYLTGYAHEKGKYRVLERVGSLIQFPKRKFNNQIEKEREIILAEKSRKVKTEKDSYLQSLIYLFKDTQPEFIHDSLGEIEDIKSINIDHLEEYFNKRFVTGNTVFAIQSKGELNSRVIKKIEEISKHFRKESISNFKEIQFKNEYKVGVFQDERSNGIGISFIYFEKENRDIDYKGMVKRYISGRLISWLAFDILREKKHLIYDFSTFKVYSLTYNSFFYGFKFVTEKEKVRDMLDELDILLNEDIFKFLKSKKGKERFDDIISSYIFPSTTIFSDEEAENNATTLLERDVVINGNISVKEAKKILLKDVVEDIKQWLNIPPHIWIESDMPKEDMLNIFKDSNLEKKYLN